MTERHPTPGDHGLITAAELARLWQIDEGRVRSILSTKKIKRVSGYPRDLALRSDVRPGQGARTDLKKGAPMFEAFETRGDQKTYRFRKLDALVRRLGGTDWSVVHGEHDGPRATVEVLAPAKGNTARNIVAVLRVPQEAVAEAAEAKYDDI